MFTIVMPIIQYSYLLNSNNIEPTAQHNNFERFMQVALPTLKKHLVWADVDRFLVIVRELEVPIFQKMLLDNAPDVYNKFHLLTEENLIEGQGSKTKRQMLLKLVIAKHIQTPQYLILDDDIILLRRFGYRDLFADARQKHLRFTPDAVEHPEWWRSSAEILKRNPDASWKLLLPMFKNKWIVQVTPQIMVTQEVKNLLKKLQRLHGTSWQQYMLQTSGRWTEYTLYWLHLLEEGRLKELYRGSRIRLSDGNTSVWYAQEDLTAKLRSMLQNKHQYFGVIQSNVPEHTVDAVIKALSRASAN